MTLEILTADDLLPFRHGFFTRKGGVSTGIFAGLNCGLGSSDRTDDVKANRRMVTDAMQVDVENLFTIHQIHSTKVLVVNQLASLPRIKCDAMVTSTAGLVLGIQTADCQPVLFADTKAGVVGAAHAGWKGALDGVLEATLDAMAGLGAAREDTHAVIGPCISQRAYEVGPEFMDQFMAQDTDYARFFAGGKGDRMMFDLPGFGLERLRRAGVASARWIGHCTYSDPDRFYSYRRSTHNSEADYGRLISTIVV